MNLKNFFSNIPHSLEQELIETIVQNPNLRLERIISQAHASPPNFWYDQKESEFVLLLKGKACLKFASGEEIILTPGDYLIIPPHHKHRVEWTSAQEKTIWLAVFF